jgi:ribose transport system permease protein
VLGAAIVVYVLSVAIVPQFGTVSAVASTLQLAAYLGIFAVGEGLVILGSGIDLSISATATATGVMSAFLYSGHTDVGLIVVAALGLGLVIGLVNGVGVAYLGIVPIVMTLAMYSIVEGMVLVVTDGSPSSGAPPIMVSISSTRLPGGLTGTVVVWVVLAVAAAFMLNRTRFGRYLYAVGTNPVAARLSGVPNRAVTVLTYVICGLTAAIAGCLILGYTGIASATAGDAYQLPAIAAVAVGGASILGGVGTALGVAIGAFILTAIQDLLGVVHVTQGGREILNGAILLGVVVLYNIRNLRRQT